MNSYVVAYIGVFLTFLILDALWLGLIAKDFYQSQMGDLMKTNINYFPAVFFYALYSAAIVYLVIFPNEAQQNALISVALSGVILGMAAYGTYNFTNLAVIKDWPVTATFVDWTWGMFVTATSALGGYYAMTWFK